MRIPIIRHKIFLQTYLLSGGHLDLKSRQFRNFYPSAHIILVRPAMVEHGTRKPTTDRLEETLARLPVHHESLVAQHFDLASKVAISSTVITTNHLSRLLPHYYLCRVLTSN